MNPFTDPDAWDAVQIAVSRNGKSTLYAWSELPVDFDGDVKNEWDVKKAGGSDGARKSDKGYVPAKFSMRWLLHKPEHYDTYVRFIADVKPRPGKEPKPVLVIVHPLPQLFNLTMVDLEGVRFPDFKVVDQWEARIDVIEWFPAPAPVKKQDEKPNLVLPETTFVGYSTTGYVNQDGHQYRSGPPTIVHPPVPMPSRNVKP